MKLDPRRAARPPHVGLQTFVEGSSPSAPAMSAFPEKERLFFFIGHYRSSASYARQILGFSVAGRG